MKKSQLRQIIREEIKRSLKEGQSGPMIDGQEVDKNSWVVSGVDKSQGQDDGTIDAYFVKADFVDGTSLNQDQMDQLNYEHYEMAVDHAIRNFHNF